MGTRCVLLTVAVAWGMARTAHADVYTEFTGTRSLAMGGSHRALGTNNETLVLNPAGMAVAKRYAIDVQYGYGTGDRLNHLNASVVDSKSGPVAGGAAFTRSWGNESGANPTLNRFYMGTAYAFNPSFALGVSGAYFRGNYTSEVGRQEVNAFNTTLGAMLTLAEILSLGVSYQNLLPPGDAVNLFRPQLGFGVAVHSSVLALSVDLLMDMRGGIEDRLDWHAGAEYFVLESVAVRAGYHHSPPNTAPNTTKQHFVSAGLGVINSAGAFNAAADRALGEGEPYWRFLGSFQFFM